MLFISEVPASYTAIFPRLVRKTIPDIVSGSALSEGGQSWCPQPLQELQGLRSTLGSVGALR